MLTQAVHWESAAVVQVMPEAQKLTPVHDAHEPGLPLRKAPEKQDVQSFAVRSDTRLTIVVAVGNTSGQITVTTPGGAAVSADTLTIS